MTGTTGPGTDLAGLAARAIGAYREGDSSLMGPMVSALTPLLWRVARSQGLDAAQAEDAVQTAWLRLMQSLERIEDDLAVLKWLVTTVRRECWAVSRRSGRMNVVDPVSLPEGPPVDGPEQLTANATEASLIWSHVQRLSERCRKLLAVIAFADRPDYQAISEGMGMPIGSIGPTRGRCLAKLRAAMLADPRWDVQS